MQPRAVPAALPTPHLHHGEGTEPRPCSPHSSPGLLHPSRGITTRKRRMAAWKGGCQPSPDDANPAGAVARPPGIVTEQLPPRSPPQHGEMELNLLGIRLSLAPQHEEIKKQ